MRFKEEACGDCGQDLTATETDSAIEMPYRGDMVFFGECPGCGTNRIMVPPVPEGSVAAEAPDTGGGGEEEAVSRVAGEEEEEEVAPLG